MAEIQGLEITFEAPPSRIGGVEEYTDLLATWMAEQFRRLAFISQEYAYLQIAELHEAPDRPENGMIILADGTDWDPGSGAGFYGRSAGAWVLLG